MFNYIFVGLSIFFSYTSARSVPHEKGYPAFMDFFMDGRRCPFDSDHVQFSALSFRNNHEAKRFSPNWTPRFQLTKDTNNYVYTFSFCSDPNLPVSSHAPGKYCVFDYGNSCSNKFRMERFSWDLMGFYNSVVSAFNLCCRDDGSTDEPLYVPTDFPFYLVRNGDTCQKIHGMSVQDRYIELCDRNEIEWGRRGTKNMRELLDQDSGEYRLNLCYYEAE